MSGYVISEVEILDEDAASRYRSRAQESIARYGGRYLVRGGVPQAVEGEWAAGKRLVVVEFPTLGRAREWYASREYAEALKVRDGAIARRLLFVDGLTSD
jgi:uncharacterized protein (DUF1330 family)